MDLSFIDDLEEDEDFFKELEADIWLMDDHKWALYIWTRYHAQSGIPRLSLFHADFHWDGGNDFHEAPDELQEFLKEDDERLFERIRSERLIQLDSFIAPAILRGFIDEVHFFCKQDDGSDRGIAEEILARSKTRQFIHETVDELQNLEVPSPLIFDLCLDLFNKSDYNYQSDLWADDEIRAFLQSTRRLIEQARLVTVSLSFSYSGTEEDTRRLAKLVLPILAEWRSVRPLNPPLT